MSRGALDIEFLRDMPYSDQLVWFRGQLWYGKQVNYLLQGMYAKRMGWSEDYLMLYVAIWNTFLSDREGKDLWAHNGYNDPFFADGSSPYYKNPYLTPELQNRPVFILQSTRLVVNETTFYDISVPNGPNDPDGPEPDPQDPNDRIGLEGGYYPNPYRPDGPYGPDGSSGDDDCSGWDGGPNGPNGPDGPGTTNPGDSDRIGLECGYYPNSDR
jgi:hypothetical protein